jgi:hypothetical protein
VSLSLSTAAATATPLYLIKISISTSACLLTSIIVSLLHMCHCTLPYHPTLPHLLSCCFSHFPAVHALLHFAKTFILTSFTLLLFLSPTFCMHTTAPYQCSFLPLPSSLLLLLPPCYMCATMPCHIIQPCLICHPIASLASLPCMYCCTSLQCPFLPHPLSCCL